MTSLWLPHADARAIDRELRQRDDRLFLAEHRDEYGRPFFEVRYYIGSETEPLIVVDWREPLTSAIIQETVRVMSSGPPDVEKIARRNEELKASRDSAHAETYEDMLDDMAPRIEGRKRVSMPRSTNTAANARRQRIRDKERRQGLR
jgi:hypothetical protein